MKNKDDIPEKILAAGKDLPFGIPDSYFEDLPARIQNRISGSGIPVHSSRIHKIRPQLAIAAMFIGLIAVGYAGFRFVSGSRENIGADEMVEAFEYFGYDFDDDLLISAITEYAIELSPGSFDFQTDELIEYLSEEDIDFVELLNDY